MEPGPEAMTVAEAAHLVADHFLPDEEGHALELGADHEVVIALRTLAKVGRSQRESEVRKLVEAINAKIRKVNSTATAGPPSTLVPLDVDRVVDRWRAARAS